MKTIINIKADRDVKENASKTAKQMGLPLSTVVNAFLRQFIAQREITFSVPLRPSKWLQKVLKETEKDWKEGKNYEGPFYSVDEFMKGLR